MNATDLNVIVFFPLFSFHLDLTFCHSMSLSDCLLPGPGRKVVMIKKITVGGAPEESILGCSTLHEDPPGGWLTGRRRTGTEKRAGGGARGQLCLLGAVPPAAALTKWSLVCHSPHLFCGVNYALQQSSCPRQVAVSVS